MAYDDELADRIRDLLATEPDVTEQKMFGGLSFLLGGHLAVAASSWGGILVRVGAEDAARLLESTKAERPEMGSRTMKGWLHVRADYISDDESLAEWVERGVTFVRGLPPK